MEIRRSVDLDGLDGIISSVEAQRPRFIGLASLLLAVAIGLFFATKLWKSQVSSVDARGQAVKNLSAEPEKRQPSAVTATPSVESESPADAEAGELPAPANSLTPPTAPSQQPSPTQASATMQAAAELTVLPTEPTSAGTPSNATGIVLYTVHFKLASSTPSGLSVAETRHLVDQAKTCPKRILVTGHTCNLGNDTRNLRLGLLRANAVKRVLLNHGIAAQHIETASEGAGKPVSPNDTAAGQSANRRADLICLD